MRMPESILGDWSAAPVGNPTRLQYLAKVPFVLGASPRRVYCLVLAISDILQSYGMLAAVRSRCLVGKNASHITYW